MKTCSMVEFREALINPTSHFSTFREVTADMKTFCRSRHFAECHARVDGRSAIIYAPISPIALNMAHTAISALRNVYTRFTTEITLHSSELKIINNRTCPIIVEWRKCGTPLSEVVYTMSQSRLLDELDKLQEMLNSNNISINNLEPNNIIVDNCGCWHLIRQYYTTPTKSGDDSAIESIRQHIVSNALVDGVDNVLNEPLSEYLTHNPLIEHRRKVIVDNLIGFADEEDNIVIECRYVSATNFLEHRSVVTLPNNRTGVIDIDGREIIAIQYDEVKYDVESGCSLVCLADKVARFDYEGKQISEWLRFEDTDYML